MPSVVSTSQASQGGSGGSFTCAKPSGTTDGHLLLAWHSGDIGPLASMSIAAGGSAWNTLVGLTANDGSSNPSKLYWKIAGSSEPASYTFTQDGGADAVATIICISGTDTIAPSYMQSTGGTGTSISTPSLNAPGTADVDIRFVAVSGSLGTTDSFTPPATYTEFADIGSRSYVYIAAAYKQLSVSGPTGAQNFTCTVAPTNRERVTVVVTGPADTPKSLADSGAGSDTIAVDTAETLQDPAVASDTVTVTADASLSDTATATDTLALNVTVELADSAAADDSVSSGSPIDFTDTAAADDTWTTVPTPIYTDPAQGADTLNVSAGVELADTAVAADHITVSEITPKDLADAAVATDHLTVTVLEDLEFVAKPLRRGWIPRSLTHNWDTGQAARGWTTKTLTT